MQSELVSAPAAGLCNRRSDNPKTVVLIDGHLRIRGDDAWHVGITSLKGNVRIENRFYDGESLGVVAHFNDHNSFWIQESFNKIVTVPWYTTTSISTRELGNGDGLAFAARLPAISP